MDFACDTLTVINSARNEGGTGGIAKTCFANVLTFLLSEYWTRPHRMADLRLALAVLAATLAVLLEPADSVAGPATDFCKPLYERSGPADLYVAANPGWLNTTWEQIRNVCVSLNVRTIPFKPLCSYSLALPILEPLPNIAAATFPYFLVGFRNGQNLTL